MKSSSQPYFQFPLCLLGFGSDEDYRLRAIESYSILSAGRAFAAKHEEYVTRAVLEIKANHADTEWIEDDDHSTVMVGAHILKTSVKDPSATLDRAVRATQFIESKEQIHGRSPLVRIKKRFLTDTLFEKQLTYREFSVLCAIYSVIGNKRSPVRINRDQIRARALGYKSKSMIFDRDGRVHQQGSALLAERQDGSRPLKTEQLKYTLNSLEARNFFARVCLGRRQMYFSHRMTREQMHEQLQKRPNPRFILSIRRQQDRALNERIRKGILPS